MKVRNVVVIPIIAVVGVGATLAIRHRLTHPPTRMQVALAQATPEQREAMAAVATRMKSLPRLDIAAKPAPAAVPSPAGGAADPTEVFDCNEMVSRLQQDGALDEARRKDLKQVLTTIAETQEEITRFSDPATRAEMQEKLIHQLVIRLRLVLGDERSAPIAALLTQKRPYVVFDGEKVR
jgi:hypothetical protein